MTNASDKNRIDTASRVIQASPRAIYQALIDPEALVAWLPPKGMTGRIYAFDAREGGVYRMSLTYERPDPAIVGKSSEDTDIVQGRFIELLPDERIVQLIEFESEDPAFAGSMTMTWNLTALAEGTEVTIVCENVPAGIRPSDHDEGMRSSLDNLAEFTE